MASGTGRPLVPVDRQCLFADRGLGGARVEEGESVDDHATGAGGCRVLRRSGLGITFAGDGFESRTTEERRR
jgi:hypothetical protein